jgi:hypothetical protein
VSGLNAHGVLPELQATEREPDLTPESPATSSTRYCTACPSEISTLIFRLHLPQHDCHCSVQPMEASSDDSFNLWSLCWEINSCFLVKIDRTSQCLKCGKEVSISSPWRSDFVRSAVASYCSHTREGFLCGSCDQETLYRITQAVEKCFSKGCEEALTVQEDVVKQRLGQDTALLEKSD